MTAESGITMTYRNRPGNVQQPRTITVFAATAPIAAGKTLAGVVLPTISDVVAANQPAMHVFAISAG